jgi:hypothetical protein
MVLREALEHGPCRPEEGCDDCDTHHPQIKKNAEIGAMGVSDRQHGPAEIGSGPRGRIEAMPEDGRFPERWQ